jgi:CheY-like chemotaxis protein
MKDGIIQQIDGPIALYDKPINKFVASFIGSPPMNFMNGQIIKKDGKFYFNEGNFSVTIVDKMKDILAAHIDKEVIFGIRPEDIDKIFDPYFTTKQKGSGLGLSTVYSIIKRHDGYISVESEIGLGSTFYVYLPASEKEICKKREEEKDPIYGKGRILLMDDEEIVRNVANKMLTNLGYEVEHIEDGVKVVELYKTAKDSGRPFDVVIMDLTIPGGMGGKEVIMKLLEIDPYVKAIVSSGYSIDPVLSEYEKFGFKGFLTKPFNIVELRLKNFY